jgi:drug/metabolite transporter (DMT)-like permease
VSGLPLRLLPGLFVLLWSTGFIGARLGMPHAEPMTFLALRFALTTACLAVAAALWRAPWPRRPREWGHLAAAGLLMHGVYLGGVFVAIRLGLEAGLSALIVSLQPLLVAAAAPFLLAERVSPRRWVGLGLGLVGVVLVLAGKLGHGTGGFWALAACVAALAGITAGTLYQKTWCTGQDLRTGNLVQFAAAALACWVGALLFEDRQVDWTPELVFALVWLVFVLSLGAIPLLYLLLRRGAASQVSSLFFLVPPTTAVIAWFLFGERLGVAAMAGMALTVAGVALVNLERR